MDQIIDQKFIEIVHVAKSITGYDVRYIRSRRREIINIKSAICNVMRKYYSRTMGQIAELLDIHHTTVIHHLKDHQYRYRDIDDYADLYDRLVKHIVDNSDQIATEKVLALMRSALAI
jgi:hypothetical protein